MSFAGIAASAGTTVSGIDQLIRHGSGSPGLAATIGSTPASITSFVNGQASADIALALGTNAGAAQELRNMLGREGAIGLIIGLACGMGHKPAAPAAPAVERAAGE
ncbi:MAG TPA: hypothetical protein VFT52_09295 [Luteimonas sp.]|jgi:hypothetical protein|nr:hypothetical protein [Luteimonas sp.]